MSLSFYPNECIACKKRVSLKRCIRCQMISYCGENHQKKDWIFHKEFCGVISSILKKTKLSHIYENLRGCSFTRQNNLTNCPDCPLASFCKDHPRSSHHDEMCSEIEFIHNFDTEIDTIKLQSSLALFSIVESTPMKSSNLPISSAEYFNQNLRPPFNLVKDIKKIASLVFCVPLTIFNALQKLNYAPSSKMTFHIHGIRTNHINPLGWEILLHLFSDLKSLTIVFASFDNVPDMKTSLCSKCISRKKKLILKYLSHAHIFPTEKRVHELPNLVAFIDLKPVDKTDLRYHYWNTFMKSLTYIDCPLILTTATEKQAKCLAENVNSTFRKSLICFEGYNNFGSICSNIDWEEWKIGKSCQFLLVSKAPKLSIAEEKIINPPESIPNEIQEIGKQSGKKTDEDNFYPGICHVCKSANSSISCKRCKMIFYCGESHMKMDWPEHKEICNAIVGLLSEKGTPYLFDDLKTTSEKAWLEAKIAFIIKAEFKLKRNLLHFEEQMFLFPKTCIVCHESDLSVLKTCKCGVSLCKSHRDDSRHRNLCADFLFDLQLGTNKSSPEVCPDITIELSKKELNLPPSMESFLNSYLSLRNKASKLLIPNCQKIAVSEFLTAPLTFIYAVEKLKICIPETMVVHIIGASGKDVDKIEYWRYVSYWLSNLKSLTIIFVGIEQEEVDSENLQNCNYMSLIDCKDVTVRVIQEYYDEFFKNRAFSKPDMIVGINLELIDISNLKCSWEKTLSIVKKVKVPFIMTASTEERATKNNEMFLSILPKIDNFEFCEKNPYGSLLPRRDFKTEGLYYSNNYLIVFKKFTETESVMKIVSTTEYQTKTEIIKDQTMQMMKDEVEMKAKIKPKAKVVSSESGGCSKSEKPIGDEHSKLKLKIGESKVQITAKNLSPNADINPKNEELIKEHFLLQQENKMLKENLYLKEENERLRNAIVNLKK